MTEKEEIDIVKECKKAISEIQEERKKIAEERENIRLKVIENDKKILRLVKGE